MYKWTIFSNEYEAEAVKDGWSWPAFLVPMFWAGFTKQWRMLALIAAFYFIAVPVLATIIGALTSVVTADAAWISIMIGMTNWIATLASMVYLGIKGNSLRVNNLTSRGFYVVDTVAANNKELALSRYHIARKSAHDFSETAEAAGA